MFHPCLKNGTKVRPIQVADIDIVINDTQAAIEGLDGVDLPSQDVAIAVMQTLAKDRWFLFAHLAE